MVESTTFQFLPMRLSCPLPNEVFTGEHFTLKNMSVDEERGELDKQDFCRGKCKLTKHSGPVSVDILP